MGASGASTFSGRTASAGFGFLGRLMPDVVDPFEGDLRLGNGGKAGLLVDMGVADQVVHGFVDGVVGEGVVCQVNAKGRVLLGTRLNGRSR